MTDEVARAKAKETELSNKVNSLDSDYKAADTQLQSTIDVLTTGLTNEFNRATEAENKIKSDLTVEINKKVASVTIEKNSTSDLQYTLYVDGKPSGEVNIPKDQLLTNVEYLAGEKIIRFTFETTSGVSVTDVNVADLVDTYIAGDGLTLVDNKFSVKKSDGSQSYLEVTADGVKVVGVDEALALKANAADVYTKDEIEAKGYLTEHQDVSSFVTKDELAEVKIKVNTNTSAVTDEVTRAKAKEIELLDTIRDNEWGVQEGQHLGGIILNKEVNKGGTDILSATVVLSEMASNALINDKGSLYVSNQAKDYNLADGKTVQLAIEELQKKVDDGGDNTELNNRLTECESQVTELVSNDNKQDAKLTSLETDVENLKKKPSLKAANTNSVAMAVNEDTITSEIKLASVDNLIRVNEDGLSFDGSIDYGTY
ncbi:unknown [Prevotella sp. CAG:1092]|nr:unknown [Prevotella sp. CAG:1092]